MYEPRNPNLLPIHHNSMITMIMLILLIHLQFFWNIISNVVFLLRVLVVVFRLVVVVLLSLVSL